MTPQQLRQEIARKKGELEALQAQLVRAEQTCHHEWGDIKYVPVHGFQVPESGSGSDRMPTFYVPAKTIPKWERVCTKCELKQITDRTKKEVVAGKIPGTSGEMDVPDFGDHLHYCCGGGRW